MESLRGWPFEPQRVNGKPVESESQQVLHLETRKISPDNFRRPYRVLEPALQR